MTQTTTSVRLSNNTATRALRRLLAEAAGYQLTDLAACDYALAEGDAAPVKTGSGGGHFTRGGTRINHPSAYGKRGWSNMVYHCSDRRVTAGVVWVARALGLTEWEVSALANAGGHNLKAQAEILCAAAHRIARDEARNTAAAIYSASAAVSTGTVVFDAEGGFRILPE